METEKRLIILQNTYAASVAEAVNTYERLNALETVVGRRKERQAQTAPYLNQQLGIRSVEDVFNTLSEIYGCANWAVEKLTMAILPQRTHVSFAHCQRKWAGKPMQRLVP